MTKKNILVTGGAGFIGSHVADELLLRGHFVRALDNLATQAHGKRRDRPRYLDSRVELIVGDVRDGAAVERALDGIDVVYHLAAAIGVGQSMYEVERYTSVNNLGTAVLMDRLVRRPVERLVVASSMCVYGEGLYRDETGVPREVGTRAFEQLRRQDWEPRCQGRPLSAAPTPESKSVKLDSVYALSKYDQERMTLVLGRSYGIPTVCLRFFNVFGARQALTNPYSGMLASFVSRLSQGHAPLVAEDGGQTRDFVSVQDVARACALALESTSAPGAVLNIGSGVPRSFLDVASRVADIVGKPYLKPRCTNTHRMGEVRHCFADVRRAEQVLGFRATADFDAALADFVWWLEGVLPRQSNARAALSSDLVDRGLTL